MTTYSGKLHPSPNFLGTRGDLAPGVGDTAAYTLYSAYVANHIIGGPLDENRPITAERALTLTGFRGTGVNDTFYNRIVIDPNPLDLGNLLSEQTRNVRVWNGFLDSRTVESFTLVNGEGISVAQPEVPPFEISAVELLAYPVTISPEGPALIDAELTWVIEGITYVGSVIGRRIQVFAIPPNWSTPVSESLEWKTDVQRSYDGSEHRRALRVTPRRYLDYGFSVHGAVMTNFFDRLIWSWQNRLFAVPLWHDKSELTADVTAGDTTISLDTFGIGFAPGALLTIFSDPFTYEAVEIYSIGEGSIVLTRPVENNWLAGTPVYPVITAHLPPSTTYMRRTDNVIVGQVSFSSSPDVTDPYLPEDTAPEIYQGLDVLTRQPNWASGITNTSMFAFDTLDTGVGPVEWRTTEVYPRIQRPYSWLLRNRGQALDFRKFLARMSGQAKTCWVPSWHNDMTLVDVVASTSLIMRVRGRDFGQLLAGSTVFNHVMIRLKSGAYFYRQITGVEVDLDFDVTEISIDEDLGIDVYPEDVKIIHLLLRCRLASDKVEIPWQTDSVATPTITFTTVPE